MRLKRISAVLTIIFMLGALKGCSPAPSESKITGAITQYFEDNGYRVVSIEVGMVEGMPLSEKTYMGTPGYVVNVVSITIEPLADKTVDVIKGGRLTFNNAKVRLRQNRPDSNTWHVSVISGISLP